MSEVELERLVVRLVGDATSYKKMVDESIAETKKAESALQTATAKIEGFANNLKSYASTALGALGSIGVSVGLMKSFWKFEEAEKTQRKLAAAVEFHGGKVKETMKLYNDFASEVSKTSMLGKGEVLTLLNKAESYGLSGQAAKKATDMSLKMAAGADMEASATMRMAIALSEGTKEGNKRAMGMARMIPQLKGVKSETELLLKVNDLMALGERKIGLEAGTAEFKINQMEKSLGALSKQVGGEIAPAIGKAIDWLKSLVDWFNSMGSGTRKVVVYILILAASIGPLIMVFGKLQAMILSLRATVIALSANWAILLPLLIAVAVAYGTYQLIEHTQAAKQYNAAVQESIDLEGKLKKLQDEKFNKAVKGLPEADKPEERVAAIQKQIDALEKEKKGQEAMLKLAQDDRKNIIKNSGPGQFIEAGILWSLGKGEASNLGRAKKAVEDGKKAVEDYQGKLNELYNTQKQTLNPKLNSQVTDGIEHLNEALDKEARLMGLVGHEKELEELRHKGATKEMLKELEYKIRNNESSKELIKIQQQQEQQAKHLSDAIGHHEKQLEEEIAMMGMANEERKLYKFWLQGATDAQLADARSLMKEKEAMDFVHKAVQDAQHITKEFLTPQEKFQNRMEELNVALDVGGLSMETYNLAVKKAKTELDKAGEAADQANQKIQGVASGSADALAKINDFQTKMKAQSGLNPYVQLRAENRMEAVVRGVAGDKTKNEESLKIFREMRDSLNTIKNGKDAVRLSPANVGS